MNETAEKKHAHTTRAKCIRCVYDTTEQRSAQAAIYRAGGRDARESGHVKKERKKTQPYERTKNSRSNIWPMLSIHAVNLYLHSCLAINLRVCLFPINPITLLLLVGAIFCVCGVVDFGGRAHHFFVCVRLFVIKQGIV